MIARNEKKEQQQQVLKKHIKIEWEISTILFNIKFKFKLNENAIEQKLEFKSQNQE